MGTNVLESPHMKSIWPIIFIILALTGAIAYSLAKRTLPNEPINNMGTPANELETVSDLTRTPTTANKVTFGSLVTVTPTVTPAVTPTTLPTVKEKVATKTDAATKTVTTTKTTVCTPVYGAAETCTEHIVVDTGAENALFFNFAGIAYLGGLLSFAKAKGIKR